MPVGVATAEGVEEASFASVGELREVLTALLERIEADPDLSARLGSARVDFRYVFPDLGLTVDVSGDGEGIHWSFAGNGDANPSMTLEMDSAVANRYLQGRESLAIGIARKRIHCSCEARSALKLLSVSRLTCRAYRDVLERNYPHLLID